MQDLIVLGELDQTFSSMTTKGRRTEICCIGAAIANAVRIATSVRVRDCPITPGMLIASLPPAPSPDLALSR